MTIARLITTFLFFSLFASAAHAARQDVTADVGKIRYHEASTTLAPEWRRIVWFTLVNPDKLPAACVKYGDEYAVSIPVNNEFAVSLLLMAKASGKKVLVTFDDAIKLPNISNGYCQLQYITVL